MKEHQSILEIGKPVYTNCAIRSWFDFSDKSELPARSVGTIFKIQKFNEDIQNIVYTVQFEKEFGYVDIKHTNLVLIGAGAESDEEKCQ